MSEGKTDRNTSARTVARPNIPVSQPSQPTASLPPNINAAASLSAMSGVAASSAGQTGPAGPAPTMAQHSLLRRDYVPPPSISLRVFSSEGHTEMELTLDHPTEEQVEAVIEVFRSTRRMQ